VPALAIVIAASAGWASGQEPKESLLSTPSFPTEPGGLDSASLHSSFDRERYELLLRPWAEGNFIPGLGADDEPREYSWSGLTDPTTPFRERVLAACLGAHAFPFDEVPRLMQTLGALRAEERQHNWGLRPNPSGAFLPDVDAWWVDVLEHIHGWSESERSRIVLGHAWRAPETIVA